MGVGVVTATANPAPYPGDARGDSPQKHAARPAGAAVSGSNQPRPGLDVHPGPPLHFPPLRFVKGFGLGAPLWRYPGPALTTETELVGLVFRR